jgi:hypothetical protein
MWFPSWMRSPKRPASPRKRPGFRPTLESLEGRWTPSTLSFSASLGGGHSAVTLQISVEYPPNPVAPEIVTLSRVLPNGRIQAYPPDPVAPPQVFGESIHEFYPPGPIRGWLQAAQIDSAMFIPQSDGGGVT